MPRAVETFFRGAAAGGEEKCEDLISCGCRMEPPLLLSRAMKHRHRPFRKSFPAGLVLILLLVLCISAGAQDFSTNYDRAFSLRQRTANLVYRAEIRPHWLADNHQLWYRVQTGPQTHEFILADAGTGARRPAFDHDNARGQSAVERTGFFRSKFFDFCRQWQNLALRS
jgi:hypothetical protein